MLLAQVGRIKIERKGSVEVVIEKVHEEMMLDPHVRMSHIILDYEEGVIILNGDVDSFYQKQLAQEAVKRVLYRKLPHLALTIRNDLKVG